MSVGDKSRHNFSAIIRVVNSAGLLVEREHLDIRPRLQQTLFADNMEYITGAKDNWSHLSWRFLGSGQFWWIIADYSQVVDPFTDIYPDQKTQYITQLSANMLAGSATQATVTTPKKVKRGMVLRIEDLDTGGPGNFVDVSVLTVNDDTGVITFPAVVVPGGGIPFALSRCSQVLSSGARLVLPSVQKALFRALDFGNPINVLVE